MTLHAFITLWITTYIQPKRAENTVRAYRFALAHLSPEISSAELAAIDPIALQMEINRTAAETSRQAQLMFRALKMAFKKAERLRLVDRSPMDFVDPPEHETKEAQTLSIIEAKAYFEAAEPFPLLRLMLSLGLRRNEARGLLKGDFENGILHIRRQRIRGGGFAPLKSRSSRRDLPVPEPLWGIFEGSSGELVADVSESKLRRQHLAVMRSIGADGVTLHGLRHTCATLAAADDVPLSTIQHLLGHRHISLTADLYCHADIRPLARCTTMIYNQFGRPFVGNGARLEIV